ncbi:hypothetical protein [Nocardia crassostreae]|uniref:hypothetical protein n=1 Tax=Nocardia crassostreae TaxID=53428 RepID=UPI0008366B8C|nr:hypothetical protein [Nocardia crassostreae]
MPRSPGNRPRRGEIRWRRRLLVMAGGLTAIAGFALAVPETTAVPTATAQSATAGDTLTVDGHDYGDPAGCLTLRKFPRRLAVSNNTDQPVRVYLLPGCKGGVTTVVEPGGSASPLGASIETS